VNSNSAAVFELEPMIPTSAKSVSEETMFEVKSIFAVNSLESDPPILLKTNATFEVSPGSRIPLLSSKI